MLKDLKNMDIFTRNIIIVFIGNSLLNFLNLLYQLLVAHRLSPSDFAGFNSLLFIFVLISAPLSTLQLAVAKYCSEFKAKNQITKIKFLLSGLFAKCILGAGLTIIVFWLFSGHIVSTFRISSGTCGIILSLILACSWIGPLLLGGLQGMESFVWFTGGLVITGVLKLLLAFIFILRGYNITGALAAFLISSLISLVILYFPLRHFITLNTEKENIDYRGFFIYLFPVAVSTFCFTSLFAADMLLVRHFFMADESGMYALAQTVGKIFLFLPGAISIVMFPRTSSLNAQNKETISTLARSLSYGILLCIIAALVYNLFPGAVLKVLTGKSFPESIILGRLFSISMSFFTLLSILISYLLSIRDLRFIKYLFFGSLLQVLSICIFHTSLIQVQIILCVNSILLFFVHMILVNKKNRNPVSLELPVI